MKYKNALKPNDKQILEFTEGDTDTPIYMFNLLKFREEAKYEDGRKTDLSGKEAYAIYGSEVMKHLNKVGGEHIFSGIISRIMIGEVEELWDWIAIVKYPSRKAMLKMISDPEYLNSEKHRSAGLKGQLNLEVKDF
tara:strand:- start:2021 stop:2428 length:408 start_codon:yes stop_codon:yes gene_type:complete